MPFEEFTGIRFVGEPNSSDKFMIATREGTYIGGMDYDIRVEKWRMCLHRAHWPERVKVAVAALGEELRNRNSGDVSRLKDSHAWLSPEELVRNGFYFTVSVEVIIESGLKMNRKTTNLRFEGQILRLDRLSDREIPSVEKPAS